MKWVNIWSQNIETKSQGSIGFFLVQTKIAKIFLFNKVAVRAKNRKKKLEKNLHFLIFDSPNVIGYPFRTDCKCSNIQGSS